MNAAPVTLERRTLARVPIHEIVTFTAGDDPSSRVGVAKDICIGGAFIETKEPGEFGGDVMLRMAIGGVWFDVRGVIRWIRNGGMGVQFQSLGARETHAITELARNAR